MSLPSTPDIKIKEEEPVEVDSSPPDSPASNPQSPQNKEKVGLPDHALWRCWFLPLRLRTSFSPLGCQGLIWACEVPLILERKKDKSLFTEIHVCCP